MSLCLYHSTNCTHGAIADRYLVRVSGLYSEEHPFDFADLAETFAASAAGKNVLAEVIDTVTGLVKKYGSVPRRESATVAALAAPGSLRVSEQRHRNEWLARDGASSPDRALAGPSFR